MKDLILGTWKLENFEIEEPNGNRRPWGKNAHGMLIYSASNHMSVSINREIGNKSEVSAQNIYDSILFYSGTYSVEDNTITHQVTEASNPQRIGKTMLRFATLDNDLLTLSSPKESFGTAHLKWRRISK
ncbi:MAG: lipocalin-like domain-containing protein [Pseudobdellovibrionaceae bacterium]